MITQAAVKQHLAHLYEKFGIASGDAHRLARLANEALRRGAVSLSELRESKPESFLSSGGGDTASASAPGRSTAICDRAARASPTATRFLPDGKAPRGDPV